MTPALAAHLFSVLVGLVVLFQLALVAGLPWGHLTLGGRYRGALPLQARMLPIVSTVLLVLFALIVQSKAGNWLPSWQGAANVAVWGVVAYCVLGVIANLATPSRYERMLWVPVVLAMLVCSLLVALA